MSTELITVNDVVRFADENKGRRFFTLARQTPFRVGLTKKGIKFQIPSGSYYPVNRELIAKYLKDYNACAPDERKLTTIYTGTKFESSYMARIFSEIRNEAILRKQSDEEADIKKAPETIRRALLLARIGQGQFRDELLATQKACYVTGISDPRFLRASHIKPWKASSNKERLDCNNGLLLSPTYDHLFDRHLISFEDNGRIIVSRAISATIVAKLGIDCSARGAAFGIKARRYLASHRKELRRREDVLTRKTE